MVAVSAAMQRPTLDGRGVALDGWGRRAGRPQAVAALEPRAASTPRIQILNPVFEEQTSPGSVTNANLFLSTGNRSSESLGVYGLPAGSQQDSSAEYARSDKYGRAGFYYLGVKFEDANDRSLRDESEDRPFPVELLIDVLGREPAASRPAGTPAGAPVPAAASSSQGPGSSGLVAAIAAAAALMLGGLLGVLTSRRRAA